MVFIIHLTKFSNLTKISKKTNRIFTSADTSLIFKSLQGDLLNMLFEVRRIYTTSIRNI